jgi:methylase of polypeptide subunit release factors
MAKAEYVNQKYVGYPTTNIKSGGKFNGLMLEGVIGGLDSGWFQGEIAESAYELERKLNRGDHVVVALEVARHNAACHRVAERIQFAGSDLFDWVRESGFHLIVSNPPYVRSGEFAAENVEVKFLRVVTAAQTDEEALEPLLAVEDEALLLVIVGHLERAQVLPVLLLKVVDELAPSDAYFRLPYQEGADRVLSQDGIEQAADLVFRPDERALDVRQPETAVFIRIVEVGYDFT